MGTVQFVGVRLLQDFRHGFLVSRGATGEVCLDTIFTPRFVGVLMIMFSLCSILIKLRTVLYVETFGALFAKLINKVFSMFMRMFCPISYNKIGQFVVKFISVYVMDYFSGLKPSPKVFFHNEPMLSNGSSFDVKTFVPQGVNITSSGSSSSHYHGVSVDSEPSVMSGTQTMSVRIILTSLHFAIHGVTIPQSLWNSNGVCGSHSVAPVKMSAQAR